MTTIYEDLFDGPRPAPGIVVTVTTDPPTVDDTGVGRIVGACTFRSDGNGHAAVNLPATNALVPSTMNYLWDRAVAGRRWVTRFTVPAAGGPYALSSVAV